jgi:hypothetical protein
MRTLDTSKQNEIHTTLLRFVQRQIAEEKIINSNTIAMFHNDF